MRIRKRGLVVAAITASILLTAAARPAAGEPGRCGEWIAKIVSVEGDVQVRRVDDPHWQPVRLNDTFAADDMIRVQAFSRAALLLCNDAILRLDQHTTLTLAGIEEERTTLLDLMSGAVHFFSRVSKSLKFFTPFVNGAVEGTEFVVRVDDDQAQITLFQGRVAAFNERGRVDLAAGQSAVAVAGREPVLETVVRPRDAVAWALYYPLLTDADMDSLAAGADPAAAETIRQAAGRLRGGDTAGALHLLMQVPAGMADDRLLAHRAGLLLSVGRVEAAQEDLRRSLALAPSNAHALALESIAALVQNRSGDALSLAEQAVAAGPDAVAARMALSYARQAHFDIGGALGVMQEAVRRDPQHALAWARLAELHQMSGNLDAALQAARRAAELQPDLALVQTVLGFSHLTRIELEEAREAFQQAIRRDQADPLPRLGLGLTEIRAGCLAQGRSGIEIAASLDPANSLIRSYLGKAYYEEKRNDLAATQLGAAKQLDPLDPTPWFYDAIRKQSVNRPVEALRDLQTSIALNDNRAVFRSRLLLDEDLAARSASLGRIYNDLGFQQLALVTGYRSLNIDPGNFSAHRFLADTYAYLPRHEIARVSELLQSQLLQPININPVGPTQAESSLLIFQGTGPSSASFNEFNPLFSRNRVALQASGVAGENDTLGNEVVVSAIYNNLSLSLGQFHQETDGFRDNNDLEEDIYNAFVQVSLTPKASLQAEVRSKETDSGDLELLFDPAQYSPSERNNSDVTSYRLGGRYAFSPGSELIASLLTQDADEEVEDNIMNLVDLINQEGTDGYSVELQHLWRGSRLNLISGAGYVDGEFVRKRFIRFRIPIMPDRYDPVSEDIHHTNAYAYAKIQALDRLNLTGGASYDDFDNEREDADQFNPKLGLTWNPLAKTTVRGAVFRVLTRTLLNDQTVEPTQVAGFNQFYDDVPGADIWTYGAAVDQQFSEEAYGGVEFLLRDLEIPYRFTPLPPDPPLVRHTDWEERVGRAYLYWVPHPWVVGSAEYLYERWDRGDEHGGSENIRKLKTQRLILGSGFFHPSGLFARLEATYADQDGEFWDSGMMSAGDGKDTFWVVDAALGYRFPKRYGLVTFEVKNLFDEQFEFQDTDAANPSIYPERLALLRLTVNF